MPGMSCRSSPFSCVCVRLSFLRRIFRDASRKAPCILFLDELDGIASSRDLGQSGTGSGSSSSVALRVLSTLLNEMDGIETSVGVIVVAATNRVHAIDPALLRPGRFDAIVQVPLPSPADRADILRIHTRDMTLAHDVDLTYRTGMAAPLCTGTNMRMVLR
jgi:SpoVK/Ycf46/Vps4 family AAA+-type ATPase